MFVNADVNICFSHMRKTRTGDHLELLLDIYIYIYVYTLIKLTSSLYTTDKTPTVTSIKNSVNKQLVNWIKN